MSTCLRNVDFPESVASLPGFLGSVPLIVKRSCRLDSPLGLVISLEVDSDASADLRLASHAIHRLLHFAMKAEAPFHCVGCCRQ